MSPTRVADWCRAGAFPDTVAADGSTVRRAYKEGRSRGGERHKCVAGGCPLHYLVVKRSQ